MNLKKLLAAVGLLTVSVPATLSVVACGNKQTDTSSDEIIKSINKITNLEINITSKEEEKIKVLDLLKDPKLGVAEAISKMNVKDFKKDSFKLNDVTIDKEGKNKIAADAKIESNKTYYFNYTYNQKASNAFIGVKIVNQEKTTVDGINKTEFKTSALVNSKADNLIKTITKEFIEKQLKEDIKKIFNKNSFEIQQINNESGQRLSDNDLKTLGNVKAKIVYTYGTNENQTTNLTITVTQDETDQKIAEAISKASYTTSIPSNSKTTDLTINAEFIKAKLSPELQAKFKNDSFELIKLTKEDDNDLIDHDLITSGTINAKIHYNYGTIKNQTTNLKITVTVSKAEIIDELKNAEYSLEFKGSTTLDAIKDQLTPEFIKQQLSEKVKAEFKNDKFTVTEVLNSENEDLNNPGTFKLQFNFIYDGGENTANSNLTITITKDEKQIQKSIANRISTTSYTAIIPSKTTVEQLKSWTKSPDSNFKLKTITKDGQELTNDDLATSGTINAKIHYNYGTIENQTTDLVITVVSESEIAEAINKISNLQLQVSDSNVDNLTNQIIGDCIKENLSDTIKKVFDSNLFNVTKISHSDNTDLTSEQLQKLIDGEIQPIQAKITFSYNNIISTTNLLLTTTWHTY